MLRFYRFYLRFYHATTGITQCRSPLGIELAPVH